MADDRLRAFGVAVIEHLAWGLDAEDFIACAQAGTVTP